MTKTQFRILYHEFLFRIVDLELLSAHAQGDASKILGQFVALLIFLSTLFSLSVLGLGGSPMPRTELLAAAWGTEHFLIATTMLAVGLFAVLSWDSTFPDRRDVLLLAPLPVRTRTIFLAKIAASATALGFTVLALNGLPSLAWTLVATPMSGGILDMILSPALYRSFAAYAITMISAGGFIFGAVLCIQGLAAQFLPRRQFLRISAFFQMATFCLLVSVYFLQPALATPQALAAPGNQRILEWLPSYWFLGLLQQLNGSMRPELAPLARRGWTWLMTVGLAAALVYAPSCLGTLRKIVEEPDITPGAARGGWLPNFGGSLETAVAQFSLRTLIRSRQHRLILAFYLGVGFAITILFLKTPMARRLMASSPGDPWRQVSGPLLASSIVMMGACFTGIRVVFSIPVNLRANWIFRISPIRGARACLAARRRTIGALALAPAMVCAAALLLWIWPLMPAAGHLALLGLLGLALTELCLHGTQKIPFTCSYLPGKSNFHLTFWLCIGLLMELVGRGAEFERQALGDANRYWSLFAFLCVIVALLRLRAAKAAQSDEAELRFEDEVAPVIMGLGLNQDGALMIAPRREDRINS